MNKKRQYYFTLILIFLLINIAVTFFRKELESYSVDSLFLYCANSLFFILSLLGSYFHRQAAKNSNPYFFVRSIMTSTVIKLFAVAAGIFLYLLIAGEKNSIPEVVACMILYVIYTIFDVNTALKLNRNGNAEG